MTDSVNLELTKCSDCPNFESVRYYTADSFECVSEWKCKLSNNKRISLQEWNDSVPEIPSWCELRK